MFEEQRPPGDGLSKGKVRDAENPTDPRQRCDQQSGPDTIIPATTKGFAALFSGHDRFHGLYDNVIERQDNGKIKGKDNLTVRRPVTAELYERHLAGLNGLGICPIHADSTATFGAVDLDVYDGLSHADLVNKLARLNLPAVVCRSKSGGAHCYLFASEPIPAALMRARLKEIASALGHDSAEIFPVQATITAGDCGGWINLPYFNGMLAARYAVGLDGPMSPEEFVQYAESVRRPLSGFETPLQPSARVPISRMVESALTKVKAIAAGETVTAAGKVLGGRNAVGLWLFCQIRDEGYTKPEATGILKDWVTAANTAVPGERYTAKEASDSLRQAYHRAPRAPQSQGDLGAGIVQAIEQALKTEHHFARDEGDILFHFEGGVYKPTGEKFVRRAVKQYCEANGKASKWSPELADKVVKYITVDAPELWERPPLHTVNTTNGLLDVKSRQLRVHSADFLSPVQIGATFDSAAKCPAIDQFVADVFPEDARHTAFEMAAWLMLPDTSIQKAVLCIGSGANGKSVYLKLLETFISKGNATALSLHRVESDKFSAARLLGKLANICPDLPTAALSGTSCFKALTGGDSITGEFKFKTSFEFRPYARLIFSANSAPRSDDSTHGFFRRWLVIPFEKQFDGSVTRKDLDARLTTPQELSGLLNRALESLPQIQSGAFKESPSMSAAWNQFRQTTDPLGVWLEGNTVDAVDGFVPKATLRSLWATDCKENGRPIIGDAAFTEKLKSLRPNARAGQRRINKKVTECFIGFGLRATEYETPDQQNMSF